MFPYKFTTLAHSNRRFLSPISAVNARKLLEKLELSPDDRILDVGCGKAEFLIHAAQHFGCSGTGIDRNLSFLEEAKRNAEQAGVSELLQLIESEVATMANQLSGFNVGFCTGSAQALNGIDRTIQFYSRLLPCGGKLLIGEPYWRQKPDAEYLLALGASEEEHGSLELVQSKLSDAGFLNIFSYESSFAERDEYEGEYAKGITEYCALNPKDPDTETYLNRINGWKLAYENWGRKTLGLGWHIAIKP